MTSAAISELKAKLSEYLARVRAGEQVLITDRGRPVARIVPVGERAPHLADLERRGLLRAPSARLADDFFKRPRPVDAEGATRAALIEERREGR
ncbi:MAG: type II toxin-antitoxin system prevent-host-death family antitoxin [Solirubrobacterales bacterium]|nr:type II toxin-antitoxin system prevent-host-death family antitoxin [Solirubrobacterales bacterium]